MRKLMALAALGAPLAALPPAGEARAATVLAAGDVAGCPSDHDKDTATGDLVEGLEGTVLALGDLAYDKGTGAEFANCYAPAWGSFKARTWPTPGNHEYRTAGARGYFAYFGTAAKPSGKSYYRKTIGEWSVYALDNYVASGPASAQAVWFEDQLEADPNRCQIAYWHEPYISSGSEHGNSDRAKTLFALAYEYGVEIVLAGHDHNYERFAEMRPDRQPADLAAGERGVRLFTAGTGGAPQRGKGATKAGSQRFANGYGVLRLTLGDDGTYSWSFENAAGSSVSDSGGGTCLPEEASTPAPGGGGPDRARPDDGAEEAGGARPVRRWAIRGIDNRTREAAVAAAEEAGRPVGAWVEQALRRALEAGTGPPAPEGMELGELEAVVRRVVAEELRPLREALERLGSERQAAGARAAEREARRR